MAEKEQGIFKCLWTKFRWDECKDYEEIHEINDPVKIFGIFKTSKKRRFRKHLLIIDIRPFELWDRFLENNAYSKLEWMEEGKNLDLSIIFECENGIRMMGLLQNKILNSMPELKVGKIYEVTGTFNYIKPFVEQGILLFFRINEIKQS